jgi:hypothetical protein
MRRRSRIRCAAGVGALVAVLPMTAACGIGHVSGHGSDSHGPSYAVDTEPTTRPVVVRVRVHAHMGRPGLDAADPASS